VVRDLVPTLSECENTETLYELQQREMSVSPRISVVIPTRNRSRLLRLTLGDLVRQTIPPDQYEIVVVIDGDNNHETAAVVEEASCFLPLRRVDLSWSGRAVARNRGAAAARGRIICFLDDDMGASPGLLESHLRAYAETSARVVLGHFPIENQSTSECSAVSFLQAWWNARFAAWSDPSHRFSFCDFCTGNVSLPKDLFERAVGFDESFPANSAGEDWEFGYRLIQMGVPFYFAKDAVSFHRCRPEWQYMLNRAAEEGRGHVVMTDLHPEIRDQLPLGRLAALTRNSLTRPLMMVAWLMPFLPGAAAVVFKWVSQLLLQAGLQSSFRAVHRLLWGYSYWEAVRKAVPSWRNWFAKAGVAKTQISTGPDAGLLQEKFR
jgi:glycosyltransferase involved in cell wall biosynthesis